MAHLKYNELWFFVWRKPGNTRAPFATSICSYSRSDLIRRVESEIGAPWRKLYQDGARAEKIEVIPKPNAQGEPQP